MRYFLNSAPYFGFGTVFSSIRCFSGPAGPTGPMAFRGSGPHGLVEQNGPWALRALRPFRGSGTCRPVGPPAPFRFRFRFDSAFAPPIAISISISIWSGFSISISICRFRFRFDLQISFAICSESIFSESISIFRFDRSGPVGAPGSLRGHRRRRRQQFWDQFLFVWGSQRFARRVSIVQYQGIRSSCSVRVCNANGQDFQLTLAILARCAILHPCSFVC